MSQRNHDDRPPASGRPPEPADVDALLSESLKAQSEQDFTWKEPERSPRWWERAEAQNPGSTQVSSPRAETQRPTRRAAKGTAGVRIGSMIFALAALMLALWVIASVVFSITVEPVIVGLVVCTLAGLALVGAGLRPKPGTRV